MKGMKHKKSVPPKGLSPSVAKNEKMKGVMKGSAGETGRATPPGLGKAGPKRGNP